MPKVVMKTMTVANRQHKYQPVSQFRRQPAEWEALTEPANETGLTPWLRLASDRQGPHHGPWRVHSARLKAREG